MLNHPFCINLRVLLITYSCQEMQQNNMKQSAICKEVDEKSVAIQSSVDSLNVDIRKLKSE